jgi:hypothetical protein
MHVATLEEWHADDKLWMTIHKAQPLQEKRITNINIWLYKEGVLKSWVPGCLDN